MTEPIILIDMDDVLADLTGNWINLLNKRHGTSIIRDDLSVWNVGRSIPIKFPNITSSEIYAPLSEPNLFRTLPVLPGVKPALREMKSLGWELVIVTSLPIVKHRPGMIVQEKCEWIEEHLSEFIKPRDLIFTYRKDLVKGNVLIDDAPHNITSYPGPTIIYDRPWNRKVTGTARVNKWSEVVDVSRKIFSSESLLVGA
jgi:5'(3')-deoxyribonucleotidase